MNPLYLIFACLLSIFYVWTLYNIPIIAVGVRHLRRADRSRRKTPEPDEEKLPTFTILVPAKNEEKVIGRLLRALANMDYPEQKKEIIIISDESTDKTVEICRKYVEKYPNQMRLFLKSTSTRKASALNYGLKYAKGEIVATFDADNVPERDALKRAAEYFEDSSTAAVQGRICSINADQNMLTKFISCEEAVRYEVYMRGKDGLKLFVDLAGTCQFVRRSVLERVGGWDEESLCEDMEMSFRLTEKDCNIRYASEIRSWQENPANLAHLIRQRTRWYRGSMEVGLKYGRLVKKLNRKRFDAELYIMGPYVVALCLVSYLMALYSLVVPIPSGVVFSVMAQVASLFTFVTLFIVGVALIHVTKPLRLGNLLWLPFIYAYWSIQTFMASVALVQILLKRPRSWTKTKRTGIVTNATLKSSCDV
jgi:cellulose synthase/poly-beta-1,6-N-acetylglucosamine synthase-like glycosyltransferase